jgi:nitrate/nitrite-specific signal transduction histidine kinase
MSRRSSSDSLFASPKTDKVTEKIIKQLIDVSFASCCVVLSLFSKDSELIHKMLRDCHRQRIDTSDRQKNAEHTYEEDMTRIELGHLSNMRGAPSVDHNMMRHLNTNNTSVYDYNFDGSTNFEMESNNYGFEGIDNL